MRIKFDSLGEAIDYCIEKNLNPVRYIQVITGDNSESCEGFMIEEEDCEIE